MDNLRIGVHIRIDENMQKKIKEIAEREHRSISQQIRYLIELGLDEKKETDGDAA